MTLEQETKEREEQQDEGESSGEDLELITGLFCQLDGNVSLVSSGDDCSTAANCGDLGLSKEDLGHRAEDMGHSKED